MTIGKSSLWLNSIKDYDKELIKVIEKIWPMVTSRLSANELENRITERLVDILRQEKDVWKLGFVCLQYKLREQDKVGDFTTKGIIDIVLFIDNSYQNYIAYECKRLNIIPQGKRRSSIAGKYVEEGVIRYVSAQYAEHLPYGCMLGFVMDGDVSFAQKQLKSALKRREKQINLTSDQFIDRHDSSFIEFDTNHTRRNSTSIIVRHRLLSMS